MTFRWLPTTLALWSTVIATSAWSQVAPAPTAVEAVVWQSTDKGLPKSEVWRRVGDPWQRVRQASEVVWPVDGVSWTLKSQPRAVGYTVCSCMTDDEMQTDKPPARCRKRATVQVPVAMFLSKPPLMKM